MNHETAVSNAKEIADRILAPAARQNDKEARFSSEAIAALGPAVTLISGAGGVLEGVWWAGTGVADTLTGGYFAIAPERATQLSVRPEVSSLIADAGAAPMPPGDRCGRSPSPQ